MATSWSGNRGLARRRAVLTFVLIAACSMLVTGAATAAIGARWVRDMRAPRIALLGAGANLSILVTAGDARVMIVNGDDPTAFAEALSRARPPTTRRLDVLVIGDDRGVLDASDDVLLTKARAVARLVNPLTTPESDTTTTSTIDVLRTPRRIRLDSDVTITLETAPASGATTDHASAIWRATVVRGGTRVVILSNGEAAARFEPDAAVSAVVVAGGRPEVALRAIGAPLVAVSASGLSGKELRHLPRPEMDGPTWAMRVFSGEAVRLDLTRSGLRFDERDAQLLPSGTGAATPVAGP